VSAVSVVGNTVVISLPTSAIMAVAMSAPAAGGAGGSAVGESGQLHHVISRPIARALLKNRNLMDHYVERDPRFVTRAADKASHKGYQQWHRDVDREVIDWLKGNRYATPAEFEAKLREIYNRPEMRARFPDGF
jgi:hypothetical protein